MRSKNERSVGNALHGQSHCHCCYCCSALVSLRLTAEAVETAKTRYFDSGEAFSGVSRKEDPLASEDDTQGPLACVKGQ